MAAFGVVGGTARGHWGNYRGQLGTETISDFENNNDPQPSPVQVMGPGGRTEPVLSGLLLKPGGLSPSFSPRIATYSAKVPNSTRSVRVVPTTGIAASLITVNGVSVGSGTSGVSIPLKVGSNSIVVLVHAPGDQGRKQYTIKVVRAKSGDAMLSQLALNKAPLSPGFRGSRLAYTTRVSHATRLIEVIPTSRHPMATIKVNGRSVKSGRASRAIPLRTGKNSIVITVTSEDGKSRKTYGISVIRAAPPGQKVEPPSMHKPAEAPTRPVLPEG